MKISYRWCQQQLAALPAADQLATLLTDRGLEVESAEPHSTARGIVAGKVVSLEKIGKKNHLCQVDIGQPNLLPIICGANNVCQDALVAVATVGAQVGGITIAVRTIDGVESMGMLCSAAELGISRDKSGIIIFPANSGVQVGQCLQAILTLNDTIYSLGITPNRGDCLSHWGVVREIAAATESPMPALPDNYQSDHTQTWQVEIAESAKDACPFYNCLLIRDVDCTAPSPLWLQTLLERCGHRSISFVVDLTNYLMLSYGQPLHAFDADKIDGGIVVRYAAEGEKLTVLDGKEIACTADTLLIADQKKAIALGGLMGGLDSGVTAATKNILIEGAFFAPNAIRGRARHFKLNSEAAFRFERGVNPQLAPTVIARCAQLIKTVAGGQAGPVASCGVPPDNQTHITTPLAAVGQLLGIELTASQASGYLNALQIPTSEQDGVLTSTTPPWRFDLKIKEDIIEEIVRCWGYAALPETLPVGGKRLPHQKVSPFSHPATRSFFESQGFHEVISYAFVAAPLEEQLGAHPPIALKNPISEDMSVMRTNLYSGLLQNALFNHRHHNENIKLFEIGRCFLATDNNDALPDQPNYVGGVALANAVPVQWGGYTNALDFFDIKGVVEKFLTPLAKLANLDFLPITAKDKALHPNKSAQIVYQNQVIGQMGELHPVLPIAREFSLPVFLFSLDLDALTALYRPCSLTPVSTFPAVLRDLSFVMDKNLDSAKVVAKILTYRTSTPIISATIFDQFKKDDDKDKKIIGIRIKLQKQEGNIEGEAVNNIIATILDDLKKSFNVNIRV